MASPISAAVAATSTSTQAANTLTDEYKDEEPSHSCRNDPDFAVICAFLQKFSKDLGLDVTNFKSLQEWLSNTDEVSPQLRDMHIKLLRKTRKTVHEKSWESSLSKFCFTYSAQDAWEVERFGYKKSTLKVKLRILRELLESQFERNAKFRAKVLSLSADSLRSQPIGRDRLGHSYWLTQDDECNLRIYQEHLDEEIWQIVATNREELVNLIARLRGNEVVLPSTDIDVIDEDSSSNSCDNHLQKPPPPEEQDDSPEEEGKVPNLRIKLNSDGKTSSGRIIKIEAHIRSDECVSKVVHQDKDKEMERKQIENEIAKDNFIDNETKINVQSEDVTTNQNYELSQNKVKPIVILQSKVVHSSPPSDLNSPIKRPIEDVDQNSLASEEKSLKKLRPTLLDSKRIKKPSKYESIKFDEDDYDDDDSDMDSIIAEGDENEEKSFEDDEELESDVGKAIEDPPLIVRGEGSGKECEGVNSLATFFVEEFKFDQDIFSEIETSETIVEGVRFVYGEGNGFGSLVGNSKVESENQTSTEPKATFFFGEPGCLKLSPIKHTPKVENQQDDQSSTNPEDGVQNLSSLENSSKENYTKEEESQKENEETSEQKLELTNNIKDNSKELVKKTADKIAKVEIGKESDACENPIEQLNGNQNNLDEKMSPCENIMKEVEKKNESQVKESRDESKDVKENIVKKPDTNTQLPKCEENIIDVTNGQLEIGQQEPKESVVGLDLNEQINANDKDNGRLVIETTETSDKIIESNSYITIPKVNAQSETIITADGTGNLSEESLVVKTDCDQDINVNTKPESPREIEDNESASRKIEVDTKVIANFIESPNIACLNKKEGQSSASDKIPIIANRKRRITDCAPTKPFTSESEIDVHSEQDSSFDDIGDDVGGKRLKMRPKVMNTEMRKKIEAKKVEIDETTSSSGEEEVRQRRRIISPKRNLDRDSMNKHGIFYVLRKSKENEEKITKEMIADSELKIAKVLKESDDKIEKLAADSKEKITIPTLETKEKFVKMPTENEETTKNALKEKEEKLVRLTTDNEEKISKVTTVNTKQKPTLAEIIEKKLKKSATQVASVASDEGNGSQDLTTKLLSPPKKAPITKPLKKNLLTQIRQEGSDDEVVPRKRTNSENITNVISEKIVQEPIEPEEKSNDTVSLRITSDRKTPDRQRKRRSSEEVNLVLVSESDAAKPVSEKFKKSHNEDIKGDDTSSKVDDIKTEPQSENKKNELASSGIGRRSGRRGGSTVVHTELPQPKRTRGGSKVTVKKEEQHEPKTEERGIDVDKDGVPLSVEECNSEKSPEKPIKIEKTKTTELEQKNVQLAEVTSIDIKELGNPKTGAARARGGRKKREVDTSNIIETTDTETPVRQSRRIAQQKIREEAERRKLEEIALRTMKQELKKKKKAEKQSDPTVFEPSERSSSEESEIETKKKIKKKYPGKGGWSSGSEEQEEPEEEDEEPPHYYTDPGSPLFKSDHEFSPESDLEDESQVVPMKRARTARKEDAEEDDQGDEEACQNCGKSDHPEWILLCDNCDKGYHCSCLSPVLFYIPEGDWYCPPCQQEQLIVALEKQLRDFDELVERKRLEEEEERRLAEEAQRIEQERLEEEKLRRERKKMRDITNDSDEDESVNTEFDDDRDHQNKTDETECDDDENDSDNKFARRSHTSKKASNIDSKRRRHDGRSRRRAAVRGARRNRRQRNDSDSVTDSGSRSRRNQQSDSDESSSSSPATDSDDEPIYKLRKRRQINVSYRLNEYDDLINSALKKEMDELAGAGNLGRGKDISTIIEADKEEKARQKCDDERPYEAADDIDKKLKEAVETDKFDESKESEHQESNDEKPPPKTKSKHSKMATKKKPRKLTTLDISSEEDHASDEDFKTSSLDEDEEEDTSISVSTNSDSSLEIYRRRGKSGSKHQRKAARRAARERRKDRNFVVEESDDEDDLPLVSKKKRREDSDYTETETAEDDLSELTENVDSADLCDDTTSDESDSAWHPSKRKKQKKSSTAIARKSPKLKKAMIKRVKRVEYSDDDISESEEEEDEEDDCTGGKGSGKQPRSQPLKISSTNKGNKTGKTGKGVKGGKSGKGKGKGKSPIMKKKKRRPSEEDSFTDSEDSNRRTRGRRYAYLEDFDEESSDGGIKPGVKRPDTPPEEREKFIQKQEEIKRMLAEKNSEGAKLAATPRLTPIKGGSEKDKRSPAKVGDSLSTVPLSVIRQAKVLDIDYLQRKGEPVGDLENVEDVESEFDDADLPDDLPEDMDEDAIARMVEEEEFGGNTSSVRELPAPDEVLRSNKNKAKETEKPIGNPSLAALSQIQGSSTSTSGLQEPTRKRLPMPTMHPPLLRHQFSPHSGMQIIQRHSGPSTHLLQNALSAPLGQPLHRTFPSQITNVRMPPVLSPVHQLPVHLMPAQQPLPPSQSLSSVPSTTEAETNEVTDIKPRGRRKKITPLRDSVQKQRTSTSSNSTNVLSTTVPTTKEETSQSVPAVVSCSSVIKSPASITPPISLAIAQPPQLYKPPGTSAETQPSVITRISHIPQAHSVPSSLGRAGIFPGGDVSRFYGPPQQILPTGRSLNTSRPPPHMTGMASSHSNVSTIRSTYGPPPPLRGSGPPTNLGQPPVSASSGLRVPYPQPGAPSEHHPGSIAATYGAPPPARHSTAHLNPYRPPIYGNPNFVPRSGPTTANIRPGPPGPEYAVGPRGFHSPYGYYPPPPPLTTSHQSGLAPGSAHSGAVPSSVIVSAPPANSTPSSIVPLSNHNMSRPIEKSLSPIGQSGTAPPSTISKNKKLTTLEAYPVSAVKSPLAIGGESSGSRGSPALQTDTAEDSSSAPAGSAVGAISTGNDGRSEFSGLVSYFSSQHDDYNT